MSRRNRTLALSPSLAIFLLILLLANTAFATAPFNHTLNRSQTKVVTAYIKKTWQVLTRSHKDILQAAIDLKFPLHHHKKWIVYIPRAENSQSIATRLKKQMSASDYDGITIKTLPADIANIKRPGLLYLPYPYVVPGGRFNAMYGWDSYFIVLGLLRDNEVQLAKDIVANSAYEINQYGKILNANRSYYLQRSQPPMFSEMVLAVYQHTHDKAWLTTMLTPILKYYRFWVTPPHLIKGIGLSRYYAEGQGPAPEVAARTIRGMDFYDRVKHYFRTHKVTAYDVNKFYNRKTNRLTSAYFTADRSVRESGFDLSNKYGPFSAAINSYAPVSLNVLLYQMALDTSHIYQILGHPKKTERWRQKAQHRAALINKYMWNKKRGLYFAYNFQTHQQRHYVYVTTYYPLWAGIASAQQAKRVAANTPLLDAPGGLLTSQNVTGMQWDAPFGWAPMQYFAVQGLQRYGYHSIARRIATQFLSLINQEFVRYGGIVEKYNVRDRTSRLGDTIHFGYRIDVQGFGWTNGVYLALLDH